MVKNFSRKSNISLADFANFCKDASRWKNVDAVDCFRMTALVASGVEKDTGLPLIVLLAKAWELNFYARFGMRTSFSAYVRSAKEVLKNQTENDIIYKSRQILFGRD